MPSPPPCLLLEHATCFEKNVFSQKNEWKWYLSTENKIFYQVLTNTWVFSESQRKEKESEEWGNGLNGCEKSLHFLIWASLKRWIQWSCAPSGSLQYHKRVTQCHPWPECDGRVQRICGYHFIKHRQVLSFLSSFKYTALPSNHASNHTLCFTWGLTFFT